jgi:hypothetical protein
MAQEPATRLIQLLEETRPALKAAIADAQRELEQLDLRRAELQDLISRGRAALGEEGPSKPQPRVDVPRERLTLHEAMQQVLNENENRWMTVHELADEINGRSLYEKRDRTLIDPSQIHARANKYPALFEKDGPRVRLKQT